VPFPFSDLSQSKQRPAIVLAAAGRGDWILCQVTSNAYSDPLAIQLDPSDLASGSLRAASCARPGKLFTANERLIVYEAGILRTQALARIIDTVVGLLRPASKSPSIPTP
jgi:mRNA interferase MazF